MKCPKCNSEMLNYGTHGEITIWRCEKEWGTHCEIWEYDDGKVEEVKPHTYLLKDGRRRQR